MEYEQRSPAARESKVKPPFAGARKESFCKTQHGFTLLEFLLAIAILSFIIGILGVTIGFSMRCWEKGEKEIEEFREVRIVLDRIAQQVKSVYPYWTTKGERLGIAFEGDSSSLTFISPVSLKTPMIMGLQVVHYLIENSASELGKVLVLKESQVIGDESVEESSRDTAQEKGDVLLSGLEDATFEYYHVPADAQEGTWLDSWYGGGDSDEPKLPQAVRIKFKQRPKNAEQGEPITTAMTVPLLASPDREGLLLRGKPGFFGQLQAQGDNTLGPPLTPGSPSSPFPSQGGGTGRPSSPSSPFGGNSQGRGNIPGNPNRPSTPFDPLPETPGGGGKTNQSTPFGQQ